MSYTNGKWTLGNPTKHEFYVGVGSGHILATIHDDTHDMGSAYAVPYLEAEANARLISVAPELLEQLELVREYLLARGTTWTGIERVIAKARGRL